MSNIRKLANGNYQTQVYDSHGKRHRRTFEKKMQAEVYIRKIESAKTNERLVNARIIKQRIPMEKAYKDFWSTKSNLAPKTIQKYEAILRQIQAFCETQKVEYIDQFERQHADHFKDILLNSGAAPKTVNAYLLCLRSIFNEQLNRDSITRNPTSHLKCLPKPVKNLLQRDDEYYTEDEVSKFFKQEIHPRYRLALMGLLLTGMRYAELANLTWEFVDLNQKMIQVRSRKGFQTKTLSSERDIPVSDRLYEELRKIEPGEKEKYVFPSIQGKKMKERRLLQVCKDIAVKSGISKNATLHKWRHTNSSLLSQMGISLEVRQYLLGHKPSNMTGHYTKLDPTKLHAAVSLLDKFLEVPNDDS